MISSHFAAVVQLLPLGESPAELLAVDLPFFALLPNGSDDKVTVLSLIHILFGHNIKEFSNLAAILPSLYAEERARL